METIVIFTAALVAGAINSVAGGGTLISFPALLWIGRDPIVANATNSVALWPASFAGMLGFRREMATIRRWLWLLTIPSVIGAALGAWLLLRTPSKTFEHIVPVLILSATLLLAAQEFISRRLGVIARAHEHPTIGWVTFVFLFQFIVGVYGGYFGAGQGIFLLGILGVALAQDLQRTNGLKNLLAGLVNGVAGVYFVSTVHVEWAPAAVIAVTSMLGAHLGARYGQRLKPSTLRSVIVVVGIIAIVNVVNG